MGKTPRIFEGSEAIFELYLRFESLDREPLIAKLTFSVQTWSCLSNAHAKAWVTLPAPQLYFEESPKVKVTPHQMTQQNLAQIRPAPEWRT
jgi:hypothetical protein